MGGESSGDGLDEVGRGVERVLVAWTGLAKPAATCVQATHVEVMYTQMESDDHIPWCFISSWWIPCLYAAMASPRRRLCFE